MAKESRDHIKGLPTAIFSAVLFSSPQSNKPSSVDQSFSTSTLLTFQANNACGAGGGGGLVLCGMPSSIPGL